MPAVNELMKAIEKQRRVYSTIDDVENDVLAKLNRLHYSD